MVLFDFLKRQKKYLVSWVGTIRKIVNENMNDKLDVIIEDCTPQEFPLKEYEENKENENILVIGGARSGKTTLGEYLALELSGKKIVISFKRFLPTKRDFDIGYFWINVALLLPNLFEDWQSFIEAFRTAFFAELSMKGLMIDTILSKVIDIMMEKPKNFTEFYKILDRLSGRGQWDENIKNIIRSKVQLLERATAGAKQGKVDFSRGNIVVDVGSLPDEESKTFVVEYLLRQINRIEEQEQRNEQIRIVIDEAWHLLKYRQQNSIVGTILLQGAYYIRFLCITQNYTHLDEDYRSHFGTIFCFRNNNDADAKAISSGYGMFIADAVKKLRQFQFIDLKYEFNEEVIEVWKVNYEMLQTLKLEAKAKSAFNEPDESFVEEVEEKKEGIKKDNLEEKIIEVLNKSNVSLYGYQIARACGLLPKDAVHIRQPLRQLDGKLDTNELQLRKKVVVYYRLHGSEQFHNLMMRESKKEFGDWKIVFEATHGTGKSDFIIEKNGKKLAIEIETFLKGDVSDVQDRVAKNSLEGIDTIIAVPATKAKTSYQNLFDCKVVLIPEIEEAIKNWQ